MLWFTRNLFSIVERKQQHMLSMFPPDVLFKTSLDELMSAHSPFLFHHHVSPSRRAVSTSPAVFLLRSPARCLRAPSTSACAWTSWTQKPGRARRTRCASPQRSRRYSSGPTAENSSTGRCEAAAALAAAFLPAFCLFHRWNDHLTVYLRSNKQNQNKKRKVGPVATQVDAQQRRRVCAAV